MTDAPAATAPTGGDGGGAPAPAPAPAPAANPAPTGQSAPAAPAAAPTAAEAAAAKEDAEWDDAAGEVFPGLKSTNKDKKNEQAKPKEGGEKTPAPGTNSDGEKPNEGPGNGDDTPPEGADNSAKPNEADKPDTAARDTRIAQQEWSKRVEAVKTDVRSKMYPDLKETLVDADGDAINNVSDVMKLVNPSTGELFTEVEAGQWFLAAQQKFNEGMAQLDKQITAISELNEDIRDQVDMVNYKYGAYLKANTDVRDELYQEWEATLTKDPKSGIITAMPYSLEKFYDRALKNVDTKVAPAPAAPVPGAQTEEEKAAEAKAAADAEAKKKADEEIARQQKRADRSDVYSAPQAKTDDPEDKEWDDAAQAYYGNTLPKK